jgi:6,7-dimethyl-8-ribityllumazine synthase
MATEGNNLSHYDEGNLPDASKMMFGIVVSEWNRSITDNLKDGAYQTLIDNGVKKENIFVKYVPGSFELCLGASLFLQFNDEMDAIICVGSLIQGETRHFEFVCQATAQGVKDVALKYNKPVIFGVLTDDTMQQAIDRSGGKHGNKGVECAIAAIKMVGFHDSLKYGTN